MARVRLLTGPSEGAETVANVRVAQVRENGWGVILLHKGDRRAFSHRPGTDGGRVGGGREEGRARARGTGGAGEGAAGARTRTSWTVRGATWARSGAAATEWGDRVEGRGSDGKTGTVEAIGRHMGLGARGRE